MLLELRYTVQQILSFLIYCEKLKNNFDSLFRQPLKTSGLNKNNKALFIIASVNCYYYNKNLD